MTNNAKYILENVEKARNEWALSLHPGNVRGTIGIPSSQSEVGHALKKIRDERLYRAEFDNFYVYCARRWGMMPDRVDWLIENADKPQAPAFAPSPKKPDSKQSRVYFMQAGELVKIGTTTDLPKRISALRLASPVELKVIATIPGNAKKEAELHKRFAAYRKHGEWFVFSDEIKSFVESLTK